MKPIIGISCGFSYTVKSINFAHDPQKSHMLGDSYIKAVENAGGIPVIIPNYLDAADAAALADTLDGLLISGGPDVDPALYGERALKEVTAISERRDATELTITRYVAKKTEKPILGICRGIQLLNVALGGSLIQDLSAEGKPEHRMEMYPSHMPSHKDHVIKGTRLFNILGKAEAEVNSFHHQAVRDVAPGFIVSAVSDPDDVIEAIELPGERFVLGVQWHPEGMVFHDEHQAIFRAFVNAAGDGKQK